MSAQEFSWWGEPLTLKPGDRIRRTEVLIGDPGGMDGICGTVLRFSLKKILMEWVVSYKMYWGRHPFRCAT